MTNLFDKLKKRIAVAKQDDCISGTTASEILSIVAEMEAKFVSFNLPVSGSSPVDDRDNPLIGEDDSWIHDVDMGAR